MKKTLGEVAFICFVMPLAYALAIIWLAAFSLVALLDD